MEATDLETFDKVTGIVDIPKFKFEHKCELCGQQAGAKIKCSDRNCKVWFHPICGKARGTMHFEIVAPVNQGILRVFFCTSHSLPFHVTKLTYQH